MVNGGGSEMEISLKPEHLGKLQLKVTIENEIVTAKFITESQQVKEVIESNLGQLKRDLQANGMQVDTILVSVGYQQGNEGFEQASYNGERSDNFSGTGNIVADEGVLETEHPVPDLKGDRVIDLIA
jgi:flagellar hook-length control protein FliK